MESRILLAASATAADVFAQFDGVIAAARSTVSIPVNFTTSNFTLSGGKAVLGVQVIAPNGSTLDPGIVQIKNSRNQTVTPIFKNANLPRTKNSVAVANFSAGKYKLIVSGERSTSGAFTVNVFLAGDVNGDRQVNATDAKNVKKNLGKKSGQSGYSASADANLSGKIDAFDLTQATANNKDKTPLHPVSLTVAPTPVPSIVLSDGSYLTASTSLTLGGQTVKSLTVTLDRDGDGFDDGSIKAGNTGNFVLPAGLSEGLNTLRVRAADSLGQQKIVTIKVTRDSIAPSISDVAMTSAFQAADAPAGHTTARAVTITGTTEPLRTVTVNGLSATAAADGAFSIGDVVLALGVNNLTITASDQAGNVGSAQLTLTRENPSDNGQIVLDWDAALLSAIASNASTPPEASREMAIVHASIYDAVNAIHRASGFLFISNPPSPNASAPAAAAAAAHRTLSHLFPAQTATFDALLDSSLAAIADSTSKTEGIALGQSVADAMLALRANDGSTNYVSDAGGTDAGDWQPTPIGSAPALLPNWAALTPFAMNGDGQFRPNGPPALNSNAWADDFAEVKSLGKSDSGTRTADQTAMAKFWDDGGGTFTPAGHWNQIAASLADDANRTLFENARMFALLDVAMADAAIAASDAQNAFDFWRPVTAIRNATGDGNAQTSADESWLPLINTPAQPEYISGHSTYSSAAAAVLGSIFGSNTGFTASSPYPDSQARTFASFSAAAQEAADSRIYGGTDFRSSTQAGLVAGNALGEFVLEKFSDSADDTGPTILFATVQGAVNGPINISGQVVDALSSIESLTVSINGAAATDLSFDAAGNFTLPVTGVPGLNMVHFVATDSSANASAFDFIFTFDVAAPTIALTDGGGPVLSAGDHITGSAFGTGSALVALGYSFDSGPTIPLAFAANGDFDAALDLSALAAGPHILKITATDAAGNDSQETHDITLPSAIPLTISATSPRDDASDVGSTSRPRIVFSRPIDTSTLNSANFFATSSGEKLDATIVPAADGSFAWLIFTDPMPGGSIVEVTVDGSTILAADSTVLDADGDGIAGGTLSFSFSTVSTSDVANTALHGIVADPGPDLKPNTADDVRAGPDGLLMTADDVYLHPLAGVTVSILGHSGLSAITGADGRFNFTSVPSGNLKLAIDGNTATPAPTDFYFPRMVVDLDILPAADNTVAASLHASRGPDSSRAQGVYLPRVPRSALRSVALLGTTTISADAASAPGLTSQQRSKLSLEVAGGSLLAADGSIVSDGQVGISTIPADLVLNMLPPGLLRDTFAITVVAPGVSSFDRPAAISFPNVFSAAPGTKLNFISFDEATGSASIEGTATVSADGLSVRTDAGQGITHPGLYGLAPPGGIIFSAGGSAHTANDYVAVTIGHQPTLRTTSDDAGRFSLFLAPDEQFELTIFDPVSGLVSHSTGTTPASGQNLDVTGTLVFNTSTQIDSDLDGLPADAELALGTNAAKADSDGDGINDGAAILLGLDPNAGRTFPTGVIASLALNGEAKDIVIASAPGDASKQFAYIATGSGGLAIVDTSKFDKPILVGQIDMPGDAVSLAVDMPLNIAAVASGSGGLQLVSIANPTRPEVLQTIDINATSVEVIDGIAYVGTTAGLESYDMITGEQLQVLPLAGGVVSMAGEGSMLYTMDSTNRLRAIDIGGADMVARGSLVAPEGGGRIFVGNGIAYVAASSDVNGGFDTVDVTDPDALTLISGSDVAANVGRAGAGVAANGSGLALTVGQLNVAFGGVTALDVFNTTDLANTASFIRRVNLPGAPWSLAIAAGIAYVADGTAGLQVVTYAPFDNQGVAPTATLLSLTADAQPGTPGLQVSEGSTVHLKATVADDVQVRSIELLVNGQVVASDVALPFELSVDLPTLAAGSSTAAAQLRVTDTGGNSTLSNIVTFNLIPDSIAPTIANIDPPAAAVRGPDSRSFRINFSEPMDAATLTAAHIRLLDSDNNVLDPIDLQLRRHEQSVQLSYDTLDSGSYHIVIDAPALKDRAGNLLGVADITSTFTITRGTISWINNAGGDWANPANWDLGRLPDATDDVFISVGSGAVITHSSGSDTVHGLRSESPFTLSGGTLTITNQGRFTDTLNLTGGTLNGEGSIVATRQVNWSDTLVDGPGTLTFSALSTVDVSGALLGANLGSRTINSNGTLNISSGLNMSGTAVINNGGMLALLADAGISTSGGTPAINNFGTITKSSGSGTSLLNVPLTSSGRLSSSSGTLSIGAGGSASGNISATAGNAVQLNSSAFALNSGTSISGAGVVRASTGTITINSSFTAQNFTLDGATLSASTSATITITGALTWSDGAIGSGLTVNIANSADLDIIGTASKAMTSATINNAGSATWSGSGGVFPSVGSVFNNSGTFSIQNDSTWNNNGGAASTFNNSGTITKSGGTQSSSFGVTFNNSGTLSVASGTLALAGGGTHSGTFNASGGTITLAGTNAINSGASFTGPTFTRIIGGTSTISAAISAQNFALDAGTLDGTGALTISNTFSWTGGSMATAGGLTRILAGGNLNITGNLGKSISARTLTNEGTATWSGNGSVLTSFASVFNNSGTLTIGNDASWTNNGGPMSTFNNSGTLTKSTGALTTTIGVIFNNSGTVNIASGTLVLSAAGGVHSGDFDISDSANLNFSNTATLAGASFTGAGMPHLLSNTLTITGAVSAENFSLEGGTIDGTGTLTVTGTINWSGGGFAGTGATVTTDTAKFNISGNTNKTINARTLTNAGKVIWNGTGNVLVTNGSVFNNTEDGTFSVQNDGSWTNNGGLGSTFNNAGLVVKNALSGTVAFNVIMNNSGTVFAATGTISLNNGGTSSGIFNAAGTLNFGGGVHSLSLEATLDGHGTISFTGGTTDMIGNYEFPGTISITGGTANFNSSRTFGNLNVGGGTFGGSGAAHVSGAMTWSRGTLGTPVSTGSITIDEGGTLAISGNLSGKSINSYTLTNAGIGTWTGTGAVQASNNSTFDNVGSMNIQSDASWTNSSGANAILNSGSMTKTLGGGNSTFAVNFTNSGTLSATSGGLVFSGSLSNSGIFNIGSGTRTITITGAFQQSSAGALNVEIGGTAGGSFDTLAITGTATLAGELNLTLVNGFTPSAGNTFQIMTFASRTGTFDTIAGPDAGLFGIQYNATNVTLTT